MSNAVAAPNAVDLETALSAIRALGRKEVRLVGFIGGYDTIRIYGTLRVEDEFVEREDSHTFAFYDEGSIVGSFVFYDQAVTGCEIGANGAVTIEEQGLVTWTVERF